MARWEILFRSKMPCQSHIYTASCQLGARAKVHAWVGGEEYRVRTVPLPHRPRKRDGRRTGVNSGVRANYYTLCSTVLLCSSSIDRQEHAAACDWVWCVAVQRTASRRVALAGCAFFVLVTRCNSVVSASSQRVLFRAHQRRTVLLSCLI
jgi:hypothetical protein